jgi:hypothetical protein
VALSDFRGRFYDLGGNPHSAQWALPPVSAGDALALGFDPARGTTLLVQLSGRDLPRQARDAALCGQRARRLGIDWFLVEKRD